MILSRKVKDWYIWVGYIMFLQKKLIQMVRFENPVISEFPVTFLG